MCGIDIATIGSRFGLVATVGKEGGELILCWFILCWFILC